MWSVEMFMNPREDPWDCAFINGMVKQGPVTQKKSSKVEAPWGGYGLRPGMLLPCTRHTGVNEGVNLVAMLVDRAVHALAKEGAFLMALY